jgi:hypothetical protein
MLVQAAHKVAATIALVLLTIWLLIGGWQSSPYSSQSTHKQGAQKSSDRANHNEPWLTKDAAGFFTFWLVVVGLFQVGLFYVQLRLIRKSLAPAEAAAKAAQDAAAIAGRSLTRLERPYLFILDYNWLLVEKAEANGCKCGLNYSVVNGGKLPASIKTVKTGLRFGDSIPPIDDVPPIHELLTAPVIRGEGERLIVQPFVDEDASAGPARECNIKGGIALIPASAFQYPRVIAKISIEYDGPVTTGHVTTACWEWHPVKYAFTEYGGPEHNRRT